MVRQYNKIRDGFAAPKYKEAPMFKETVQYKEAARFNNGVGFNKAARSVLSRLPITLLLAVALMVFLSGCVGMGEYEAASPQEEMYGRETPANAAQRAGGAAAYSSKAAPMMLAEAADEELADTAPSAEPAGPADGQAGDGQGTDGAAPQKRLRVYSAELELAVTSVEASRETAVRTAEEAGGYVESSSLDYVVIRVPAETFESVLSEIEGMGTILSRAVRTADVTEQFSDLKQRIDLSERTRERLYALLDRATETEERVKILREIRRLTEEIERMKAELESLDRLVRFSRITVRLVPRIARDDLSRDTIPFPWIARLDPLEVTTEEARGRIPLQLSDDFAVFEEGKQWLAEAAEGTRLKAGAVPNEPLGDSRFWARALEYHLRDFYSGTKNVVYGRFRGVLFESKDPQPFFYLAVVHVEEGELIVVETFFPNREALERRIGQIERMLSEAYRE